METILIYEHNGHGIGGKNIVPVKSDCIMYMNHGWYKCLYKYLETK